MSAWKINEIGYSHILTDILNLSAKEDDYSIYRSFLKMLDKVAGNNQNIFSNLDVKSPVIKAEDDHVDVSIKDSSYRIIIENKIKRASDGNRQLARYIDGSVNGAHYLEKDVYVVYITDVKKSPSRQTWIRRQDKDGKLIGTDFKDALEQHFVNITKTDIYKWLEEEVINICRNNPEQSSVVDKSIKYFCEQISKEEFSDYILDRKNYQNNITLNFNEIIYEWKDSIEFRYNKEDIVSVTTTDSTINVEFRGYDFGCKVKVYSVMDGYEKTMLRYGISKIGKDIECFTKYNLEKLFKLFFSIDRYHDKYRGFEFPKEDSDYWAYKTVQLWRCNDYEYKFALNYYLLDLIDKIIMFFIAPSKVGLLSPIKNFQTSEDSE